MRMSDPDFAGVASGGSPGFGGVDTGFEHGGRVHGGIETQPHDWVHGLVGGSDPQNQQIPGLMSDPDTAGLDPIFWLHHANIDRLWEVWRRNPSTHVNPTDVDWIKGPANVGGRIFSMPMPDGNRWDYTPGDMADLAQLDYTYDDLSPAAATQPVRGCAGWERAPLPRTQWKELLPCRAGTMSNWSVRIEGLCARRAARLAQSVQLDTGVRRSSLRASGLVAGGAPDRVFLNLENVRGLADSTAFQVYVGLPDGANPADHPERLAGSIALFGVRKASLARRRTRWSGPHFRVWTSRTSSTNCTSTTLSTSTRSPVRIVPVKPVSEDAQVSIGRVSIFRQGR